MALLVAFMLIMMGTTYVTSTLQQSSSPERGPALLLNSTAYVVFFLVFCLFPDGRLVPRWIGWLPGIWLTWSIIFSILYLFSGFSFFIHLLVWLCMLFHLIIVQIYRYQHVSSSRERQQTKWVIFGVSITIVEVVALSLLLNMFPLLIPTEVSHHLIG